ncbi:MAG: hypothetical protein JXA30_03710 [Deltaproteobacteria bacterium]|nr:hypothetical protein [Deltaproteobacteria bacterium]
MKDKENDKFVYRLLIVGYLIVLNCCTTCGSGPHETRTSKGRKTEKPGTRSEKSVLSAESESNASDTINTYTLFHPDQIIELPNRLKEISGITDISDYELGCVQDEDGIIFIYDLKQQKIARKIRFGRSGDYEGLTRVGNKYFVLRSDGLLYEIMTSKGKTTTETHKTGLPTKNNEGLGFDPLHNRLLIAPKSRLGKGREYKDTRAIFSYDLESKEFLSEPVFKFSIRAIQQYAEARGQDIPTRHKKKGEKRTRSALRFMPSSIAVHPMTGEFFVLSAIDHVLATFDKDGGVTGYARLNPKLFRQPEGITFLSTGDMVIANEGAGNEPTLLFFKWKGKPK